MEYTENYNLKKPAGTEPADIGDINDNMDMIDEALATQAAAHSEVPNVSTDNQTPTITEAETLTNLSPGDTLKVIVSKVQKAITSIINHLAATNNPHRVTKAQLGIDNVPNVATNDQTPTYNEASSLGTLISGEKISVAFGKIKKAITSLIYHLADINNPHNVTKAQLGLDNVPNVSTDNQTPTITEAETLTNLSPGDTLKVIVSKVQKAISTLITHTSSTNNPHNVTKAQVGLGSVQNVSTNDQTPTYTEASSLATLVSGEKLSVAFGKIKKAITSFINHLAATNNPHSVTKAQVGLGNVDNVSMCYKVGDAFDNTGSNDLLHAYGNVRGATSNTLRLAFPMRKLIPEGLTVNVTKVFLSSICIGSGGTVETENFDASSYIDTVSVHGNVIQVKLTKSGGWLKNGVTGDKVPQNTAVAGIMRAKLSFS